MNYPIAIPLKTERDVGLAREKVNEIARTLLFEENVCAEITLAVSEIAQNAVVHGKGGNLIIDILKNGGGIRLKIQDQGKGIAHLGEALKEGYSTQCTLGVGLGVAKRSMDKFEIASTSTLGTMVLMEKYLPYREDKVEYGVASLPDQRYQYNGDSYIIKEFDGDKVLVGLVDGIGQGYVAYKMAELVKKEVLENYELSLNEIITICHVKLLESEFEGGCAINLALLTKDKLQYLSVGDTHGYLLRNQEQELRIRDGRVGAYHLPSLKIQEINLRKPIILVLCTDGIKTTILDASLDLEEHANILAIRLFNKYHRLYGDATVLVIKWKMNKQNG